MQKIYFLFIFLCVYVKTYSQQGKWQVKIDSLQTEISQFTNNADTNLANIYLFLAEVYLKNNDYEKSITTGQKAEVISNELKFIPGAARSIFLQAWANNYLGNSNEAIKLYQMAMSRYEQINHEKGVSQVANNLGISYKNIGNYPEAIRYYFKAIRIHEKLGNIKSVASTKLNIGNIYLLQKKYNEALHVYREALETAQTLSDKPLLASCYDCIGSVYCDNLLKYEEAYEFFQKSLSIRKELGDKKQIAGLLNNMGVVKLNERNYEEARQHQWEALKLSEELNDKQGVCRTNELLGNLYTEIKEYEKAEKSFAKSLELAHVIHDNNRLFEIYFNMAQLDSARGNYAQAWKHLRLSNQYLDSLKNEESVKKIAQQQMQYEFDKKELQSQANFTRQQDSLKQVNLAKQQMLKNEMQWKALEYEAEKKQNQLKAERDLQLSALKHEFEKKQLAAKSEEEKRILKYEEELKRNQINFEFKKKEMAIDEQRKRIEIHQKIEQERRESEMQIIQVTKEAKAKQQRNLLLASFAVMALGGLFYVFYSRQKQDAKRKQEMEAMKQRISRDLHDDIGSTLSTISKYAELANVKLGVNNSASEMLGTVNLISKEMLTTMSDIVWSLNPKNDSLEQLVSRLQNFCASTLTEGSMQHEFRVEEGVSTIPLNSVQLKEIYLIGKEAINNSMKYSKSKNLRLNFSIEKKNLVMEIKDDGIGFAPEQLSDPMGGYGLLNMKERAKEIMASLDIFTKDNEGCAIKLKVPIN